MVISIVREKINEDFYNLHFSFENKFKNIFFQLQLLLLFNITHISTA